jgi:uncharacterized protein DUF4232
MTRLLTLAALILATGAASCASAATHKVTSCSGSQLAGTFKVVPGSAGAGNIVYALVLKNVSKSTCRVSGLPHGRLLGKTGKPLPTHVVPAFKGALTAVLVTLAPGRATRATARFSPDVPGPGESTTGRQCEPTSYWFRVAGQGGGTTKVRLQPATPVCEHGQLQLSAYGK